MNTAIDLNLDLVKKPDPSPMVYAKQNDVQTRMLRLHLMENGRSWPIPESARPALIYRKADGTGGSFDTLPDGTPAFTELEDGFTLTLAPQMLTCEGMVKCQLVLLTDTGRLSSFSWRMYVEYDLAQSGSSEDYYRLNTLKGLQEALDTLGDDLAGLQEAHKDDIASLWSNLNTVLDEIKGNNALEIDLTQDFASSGLADPVQYFLNNADAYENKALLRVVHNGSVYTARCIHTHPGGEGCQYVEITDYGDDGFVEKYVYCNGELESNIGYAAPATGGKAPYLSVKAAAEAVEQVGRNTEAIAEASAFITEAQSDIHDLYGVTTGLDKRLTLLENVAAVESWADVQRIVRAGLASRYFAIGDQLQCKRGDKVLTWDVIGIDHDTPADPQWSHSMTLQLHDCLPMKLQFDAAEPGNVNDGRAKHGSNNWLESNIRQWLNADGGAGAWWQAQTEYDAAPAYANEAGFLHGLDQDFRAVLGSVLKKTRKTNVIDGGGTETVPELAFLMAESEVNGSGDEGNAYQYYLGAGDAERVKTVDGVPSVWFLRTPNTANAYAERVVLGGGSFSSGYSDFEYGIAPAVCIV